VALTGPDSGELHARGPNGGVYNPANMGLYGYVYNNPINYVDREGEFAVAVGIALGAGIDLYQQYRANSGSLSWNTWDWKRTGLAAGFGALGGGAAIAAASVGGGSLGMTVLLSGVYGGAVSGAQEAAMRAYAGQDFDPQRVAQSAFLGGFGSALGAAAGAATSALLSRASSGSREGYLIALGQQATNKGSLGGPLGGAESATARSAAAGREATQAVGDLVGDSAGKAYENLAPGGGGDAQPSQLGKPQTSSNPVLGGGRHQAQTAQQRRQIDDFRRNYLHE